jgi:hypothetical protein
MDWFAWLQRCVGRCWIRLGGAAFLLLRVWTVAAVFGGVGSQGQNTGALTVEDALHRMSARAAVVFVGQVVAVRRVAGVVEVEFQIDQAVRGCSAGSYVLREWAGLWAANDARYRVGQRRLMLLHAPGAGGMSSPVDGTDGAMPVYGAGTGANGELVDLRWLGTKLQRPVVYASPGTVTADTVGQKSIPAQAAGVNVVVGLLRGWSPEVSGAAQ